MAHIFISHATEDVALATDLVRSLEGSGLRCWYAARDVDASDDFASQVTRAIDQSSQVVVVISNAANGSPHVRRELERSVGSGKRIVPLRVSGTVTSEAISYFLAGTQWIDTDPTDPQHAINQAREVLLTGPTQIEHRPPAPFHEVLSTRASDVGITTRHPVATIALVCSSLIILSPIGLVLGLIYLLTPGHPPEGRLVAGYAVFVGLSVIVVAAIALAVWASQG